MFKDLISDVTKQKIDMRTMHAYIIFLAALCGPVNADTGGKPYMYSNITYALENEDFNIFCVTQADATRWSVDNADNTNFAVIQYYNNECTANNFIINNTTSFAYSYHDESNAVRYTLTLKNVHVSQNKQRWFCAYPGSNSSELVVNVSALVKNVTIQSGGQLVSSALTLQENDVRSFTCTSSFSIPRANMTWFVTHRSNTDKLLLTDYNLTHTWHCDIVGFESTTSTLLITFNRTYNGCVLVCEAENIQGYRAISKNVSLNITYPTDKPLIQCTKNGIYKVFQKAKGNLTCSVEGGNPAGALNWNCTGNVTDDQVKHNKVTQIVVWNATQTQYCTCNATNNAGTSSTTVKTEVLYPPELLDLRNKTVIEGDSVTLHCDVVRANPTVNRIQWTSNKHDVSGATLTIIKVSRSDDMVYSCTAHNSMDPSCQDVVNGSTSKSLHVDVLYPPYINISIGKTFSVNEGDNFNYTCPAVTGNPSSTNITWRRSNNTKTWSSSKLLIRNITRFDDSVYTCYASNVMVNSNGNIKIGYVNADIRLKVKFKTNVTDFFIRGYGTNISVVVMETIQLIFTCRLQGYPTADVRIYKMETVVNNSNANELLYYTKASCSDGPVYYSCHGNNSLNNQPSTRSIQLFVRCKPRSDVNSNVQFIVTSAVNQTATMSYTALSYPYPSFVWYRNGSSINSRGSRINIFSTDLQTYLFINQVEEDDFGEYTLTVTNDLGSVNELFHIKPQEPTEQSCHCTTQNVLAIVGGTMSGMVVLCGIFISVFIYRRRCFHSPINNEEPERSTVQSSMPVTYENLKMDQIPNDPVEFEIGKTSSRTSETNLDHTYEGLSRENKGKETEYTCLGGE